MLNADRENLVLKTLGATVTRERVQMRRASADFVEYLPDSSKMFIFENIC